MTVVANAKCMDSIISRIVESFSIETKMNVVIVFFLMEQVCEASILSTLTAEYCSPVACLHC